MAYTKKYTPKKKESKFRRYARKGRKVLKTTAQVAADVARLSAAVAYMGTRLNSEKKFKDADVLTSAVGQTFGTLSGWNGMDVTPVITQGTDSDERVGNSLKLTGMSIPIQFSAQSNCLSGRKLKVMLFRVHDSNNNVSITDCIQDYLDPNPLNGLHDMGSPLAYRAGKHDGIKLIRSKVYNLPAPTIVSSGNANLLDSYEKTGFTCKFNVKFSDVLRYGNSADDKPDGTRYYLYVMCDKGNHHPTATTTQDVPVPTIQSGVSIRVSQRSWWVDN